MDIEKETRPEVPPITVTFADRTEILALLDMARHSTSLFNEDSAGDKLVHEVYKVFDVHINNYGGHCANDDKLTGRRK